MQTEVRTPHYDAVSVPQSGIPFFTQYFTWEGRKESWKQWPGYLQGWHKDVLHLLWCFVLSMRCRLC